MGCEFSQYMNAQYKLDDSKRSRLKTIDSRRRSTKITDAIVQNVIMISQHLTQQQVDFCIKSLKEHPLFNNLEDSVIQKICWQMVWVKSTSGQYLFKQGEQDHSFFLIQKGKVSVEVDGVKISQLSEGQVFGELTLLFRTSRTASIKCDIQESRFFVLKPTIYKSILKELKTTEYPRNRQIIQKISVFQCLTNKQKYALSNCLKQIQFKQGEVIFTPGEISQGIYFIFEGCVEITLEDRAPLLLTELQVFGESALKHEGRRQGQAKAKTETKCLTIGKKDMEKSLGFSLKNLTYFNQQKWALIKSKQFAQLSTLQLNKILLDFQCIEKLDGQVIDGHRFQGLVISLEGGISNQPEGTMFNIQNWRENKWKCQNLVKNGKGKIGYLSFQKLTKIIQEIQNKKRLARASQKCIVEREQSMSLLDFQVLKKLGQGQFGQVYLVKNKKISGHLYAVKCLSKQSVRSVYMEKSVAEEKKILQKVVFPYIVSFVKAFHDKQNIFLLMEYIQGQQMFDVIRQMRRLTQPIVHIYFGCILLAIEYLHMNNIIYRDIKPQNSVIDRNGKVFLIDMGAAKELISENMYKTFTIIGTPHYMAPEVFEGSGYSFQADYWSLGVLLYELVCGKLPFGQWMQDPFALFELVKKSNLEFPQNIDEKAKSLIRMILVKDPKQRREHVTFEKIKKHEYFQGFNWQDLLEERIPPPYIPRNFRDRKASIPESTGKSFMTYIYGSKDYGHLQNWSDQNVF